MKRINIRDTRGKVFRAFRPIERLGAFAIHRTLDGPGYTVTHVPTGFAILSRIETLNDARALVVRIADKIDWNFRKETSRKFAPHRDMLWENYIRQTPRLLNA